MHRNLACVIDKSSRGAKLERAFEELPQVSYQDILAAYGVAPKLLRRWCKIYSEHGEAGLQPKKRGRQLGAKQKPVQELTPMEKLELRIKQLEAENAILKKVAALKDWRN